MALSCLIWKLTFYIQSTEQKRLVREEDEIGDDGEAGKVDILSVYM